MTRRIADSAPDGVREGKVRERALILRRPTSRGRRMPKRITDSALNSSREGKVRQRALILAPDSPYPVLGGPAHAGGV